ncbi:MAG: hypothetical protein U9O94_02095 [Nanoarchaeota archaeon]|nr:hypothetical protein [Nanoarchaeota archaeon]
MKTENFFLRYAYPCAYIIMQRGEITSEQLKELEQIAIDNKEISREKLEKIFHRAFEYIDRLAEIRCSYRWDKGVIEEYFYSYHNEVIDNGEGVYSKVPTILKELSKVEEAIIVDKKEDALTVEYKGNDGKTKTRNVLNHFVPDAKVNDKVTIHYGYAIEIVE